MTQRARGVERKLEQKREALDRVLEFLGGKERMTDKLYRRFSDRRTFTTEDLRELNRLFRRAAEEAADGASSTSSDDEGVIQFRRRLDGSYQRTE